jgi:cell division protein FtsW
MYLPEVWGDSIFPIIAEETGFIFCLLLILLYLFLFYRGLLIARAAPDIYGSMLAIGIVTWLAVQTFLNIGGMVNLIPMTGVPLPFVSSGGSAILSSLLAMGILVNISKQTKGLRN